MKNVTSFTSRKIAKIKCSASLQLSPIHNLIPLKMKDAHLKKENLEKAIDDYVNEYSLRKCHPCQNGGTVLLLDGKCVCSCPITAEGIACEISKQVTPPGENKLFDILSNTNMCLRVI